MSRYARRIARKKRDRPGGVDWQATRRAPMVDGGGAVDAVMFDGRTLRCTVFVHTDEPPEPIYERLAAAARGPLLRATAVLASRPKEDLRGLFERLAADAPPSWKGPRVVGPGEALVFDVYTNTDERGEAFEARIQAAIDRPEHPRLWIAELGELPREEGYLFWNRVREEKSRRGIASTGFTAVLEAFLQRPIGDAEEVLADYVELDADARGDWSLRHDGRTLAAHLLLHTTDPPADLGARLVRAARGESGCRVVTLLGLCEAEAMRPLWATILRLHGQTDALPGGETYKVDLYANTDEDAQAFEARIRARLGEHARYALLVGTLDAAEARAIWTRAEGTRRERIRRGQA